jgi:hypothetical protein
MFGEVFLVTARHVASNGAFDLQDLRVPLTLAPSNPPIIQFSDVHTFISRDPNDTDHVDVIVARCDPKHLNRSLFTNDEPFDITLRPLVTRFTSGMKLYFKGLAPAHSSHTLDDDAKKYCIAYAAGDLIYRQPSGDRSVHIADVVVNDACPDFNGMSGSPIFLIDDIQTKNTNADFAGMLIRGSRDQKLMRFLDAELISTYLAGFFLRGLSPGQAETKLQMLLTEHARKLGHPLQGWT